MPLQVTGGWTDTKCKDLSFASWSSTKGTCGTKALDGVLVDGCYYHMCKKDVSGDHEIMIPLEASECTGISLSQAQSLIDMDGLHFTDVNGKNRTATADEVTVIGVHYGAFWLGSGVCTVTRTDKCLPGFIVNKSTVVLLKDMSSMFVVYDVTDPSDFKSYKPDFAAGTLTEANLPSGVVYDLYRSKEALNAATCGGSRDIMFSDRLVGSIVLASLSLCLRLYCLCRRRRLAASHNVPGTELVSNQA
ncbi:unnamed protein product [Symbiodinium necroappetens]|uniref:Uncharacterized protein n=1 Tax=Symbiodinium necroappetens TaxID=1628268 RepID=A0A813BW03_9DINO|nr:unnamed protein product [Symbiodinium necroappetens]